MGDLQHELAWEKIRCSQSYQDIIELANDWFTFIWDIDRDLGICPSGHRVHNRCPCIKISNHVAHEYVGMYYPNDHYHGPSIRIVGAFRMARDESGLFPGLRHTILHEAQHALDDRYGTNSSDHNHWYQKRLDKLITLFPIN